ncbi:MAG: hypothetical protein ACK4GR_06390, partial [bacterium]
LSNNKFRLFVWISRLLLIANIYNLSKIKEKLIEVIKSLGYEKFLNYINIYSSKQIDFSYIFEEVILEENYEQIKDGLREVVRYLIQNGFAGNFIKIYKKLKEKYSQEKIEDIFVEVLNEEKEINFVYIFLNLAGNENIDNLNIENIELLVNNFEYNYIIDNLPLKSKARLILKLLKNKKLNILEKIIKRSSNIELLAIEIYSLAKDRNIEININDLEANLENGKETKIILYPLLQKLINAQDYDDLINLYSNLFFTIKPTLWIISYINFSHFPSLLFINYNKIKEHLVDLLKVINETNLNDTFKNEVIQTLKLSIGDASRDEFNSYIYNIIDKYESSQHQFFWGLVQA